MSITAMKQALEALKKDSPWREETITALRQAIEQAEKQEPVAWMYGCVGRGRMYAEELDDPAGWQPLYTTPQPQREWVGLTLDEIDLLEELYAPPVHPDFVNDASHCLELIRHVEAKLKEKNHG